MGWKDAPLVEVKPGPSGPASRWQSAPVISKTPVLDDVAGGARQGFVEGVEGGLGLGGDVSTALVGKIAEALGMDTSPENIERIRAAIPLIGAMPTTATVKQMIRPDDYQNFEPKTTEGQFARTITSTLPAAVVTGGAGGARGLVSAIASGVGGGASSEAAGQATEGTKWETPARLMGGLAGGVAPQALRRVVTPRNVPAENRAAADVLRREGVGNLTEGQITRDPKTLVKERQALGNRAYTRKIQQSEQFTRAALRRIGENADRATPDVIDGAFTRIGQQFDDLSARNQLLLDRQFADDLRDTVQTYARRVEQPNRKPAIADFLQEIQNHAANGVLPGGAYQSLRSRIQAEARAISDADAKRALFELADDLDDAMERSIARTNPADLGNFRTTRRQYKNLLVIENAATVAGSDAALGLLSPAALRSATKNVYGKRNMARGRGDFEELSRAAAALLSDLPQTGYAPAVNPTGLANMNTLSMVTLAIPRLLRELRMTGVGTRYMTNRLLTPEPGGGVNIIPPMIPAIRQATEPVQ